ncbi:hypothetical protein B296_00006504 [Ensete ventricosum]|uniref:Protein kinase domain-containing protein n=1 Tax=Ensete ventricosum TaxID=4639 RepID=A0A427AAU4_ENSVE|nr:hypothetical protein B296_00006504 [Ensete ventricosum]
MPSHSFACKLLHCAEHPTHKASAEEAQQDAGNGSITAQTFTFRELASATKNFRPEFLLGEEGFGRVYKGCLENNGQVNCGTSADQKPISWYTRMKIAYGTAQGLEFLHEKADPPVIYRELKPSNILLDEDFNPKLSDIGLAKGDKVHVSSMVMDTNGYSSPEYTRTGQLTLKSDVYSFGVVMLELITGRSVMDTNEPNLVAWLLPIGGATMEASLRLLPAATVQLRVGLVVDDVKWQRPGSLRLSVVLPQHRLRGRGLKRRIKKEVSVPVTLPWRKRKRGRMDAHCFYEIVVWDLREEVVDDMSSDVVVDVVYPPVVSVDRRQSSTQIAPLLRDGQKKVV